MSDQKEIETNRYARRTIQVKGLAYGTTPDNAIQSLSEYGVHWNMYGKVKLETTKATIENVMIAGDKIPSGLTSSEREWVLSLAEKHGIDVGVVSEEVEMPPTTPYIKSPILIHDCDKDEWIKVFHLDTASATIELSRGERCLTILIEGVDKKSVSNSIVDEWVQEKIKLIRDALAHAGYVEHDLEIDCEVIMGAEREAKCDPNFMRSLLTTDQDGEEE